jgi:hypothetical protein
MIRCASCKQLKPHLIEVDGVAYICLDCKPKHGIADGKLVHSIAPGELKARSVISVPSHRPAK